MPIKNTLLASTLLLGSTLSTLSFASLNIIASIKPIQLITQAITEGVNKTDILLSPNASPHTYSLKPSDMKKLQQADVIFWVGVDMEVFLEKTLSTMSSKSVSLMNTKNIYLKAYNEHNHENNHKHNHKNEEKSDYRQNRDHNDHQEHNHSHQHGDFDPHVWLSPNNAVTMAKKIMSTLIKLDPDNAKKYQQNFNNFAANLKSADKKIFNELQALNKKSIFMFHDAYRYLSHHYNFPIEGYISLNPSQNPSLRYLHHLKNKIGKRGVSCVFYEPQFSLNYVQKVTKGLNVKLLPIDPLASNIQVNATGYIEFIKKITSSLKQCL